LEWIIASSYPNPFFFVRFGDVDADADFSDVETGTDLEKNRTRDGFKIVE
jgi:hypothetical protein